jgi:hypothetical protein
LLAIWIYSLHTCHVKYSFTNHCFPRRNTIFFLKTIKIYWLILERISHSLRHHIHPCNPLVLYHSIIWTSSVTLLHQPTTPHLLPHPPILRFPSPALDYGLQWLHHWCVVELDFVSPSSERRCDCDEWVGVVGSGFDGARGEPDASLAR